MKFKLFNHEVNIETINYEEPIVSLHTGKELEKFSFDLKIKGKTMNDAVQKEIPTVRGGGIFSVDHNGNNITEYRLENSSYSYNGRFTDENTTYSYTLHLEEVERLNLTSLLIGDLEVFPYEYEERYDDGLIINTKIKLTKDEAERLDNLDNDIRYFEVVRKGISENKKEMRFGRVLWSEDKEFVKKEITLVEKIHDEVGQASNPLFYPEMWNMMDMLSYNYNLNNELINLLVSKDVVDSEIIEEIKDKANKNITKTNRKFYQVVDIDKF